MRKKRLFIILWAFITALPATAQWSIGASGGYVLNIYNYDPQYMTGMEYNVHDGFTVDIPVGYRFNEHWGVVSGLSLQDRGFVFIARAVDSKPYQSIKRDDFYLNFPAMAEFSFGKSKWQGFINAGAYAGYWCKSILSYYTQTYLYYVEPQHGLTETEMEFSAIKDRRVEIGIVGGVGIMYTPIPSLSLFVLSRCYQALTPQQKDYQIKRFSSWNTTLTAQIGIFYNFKSNQK